MTASPGASATARQRLRGRAVAVRRRGSVLVEFALVSFALYLLLAAILTFGYLLYAAQGLQQAADVAAREISRTPLPADRLTLEDVLDGNANAEPALAEVRRRVYDKHYLVLNLDSLHGRDSLQDLIGELPAVNQQLVPLMISDQIAGTRVLRYPGAVFEDNDPSDDPGAPAPPASGYLVAIPLVVSRGTDGVEAIELVPVVEEIDTERCPGDDNGANPDPFRITSPHRGLVALRINYPYQAAAMSGFLPNPDGPFEPTIGDPVAADDGAVMVQDPCGIAGSPVSSDFEFGPYAGPHGLGRQAALRSEAMTGLRHVRPFRRLISAQAIARREVFGP